MSGVVYLCACHLLVALVLLSGVSAQNRELSYTIYEEGPVPFRVGDVARDSNVSQLLGTEIFATLRYRVLSQDGTNSALFSIGDTSGKLHTAARIDRESLCHFSDYCRLHFPQSSVSVPVTENSATGLTIDITPAVDLDVGANTIQNYDLVTQFPTVFGLEVTRNLDGSLVPNLVINSQLDREARDFYRLTILAVDGGTDPRTGILTLNITVEDVNDSAPTFSSSTYNVSVNETLPRRTVVAKVKATDRDIGFNGDVRYRFSSRQTDDNANAFGIDETSGEVISMQDLTSLQGKTLKLVVEAVDRGSKPLKAQAIVNVHVIDTVNDYPTIRLTTISGGNMSLVKENTQNGYVVAHFLVVDTDSGNNGIVSCSASNARFDLQKLNENEYKVTLQGSLDREVRDRYDVQVRCWDHGRPPRTSVVSFSVIVQDVNDNSPRFSEGVYRRNVTEEQGPGVLLRVYASDKDIGENGRVTYKLGNATSFLSSLIAVVPTNGDIVAKKSFDREVYKSLDFFVMAEDNGPRPLASYARVILTITDINDRKPSLPPGYTLKVPENKPSGTEVGRIEAIDEDEGESGQVFYQLLPDDNANAYFQVSSNGVVRTRGPFDREQVECYHLSVVANDRGTPPLQNVLKVVVQILDENDNVPKFIRPNGTQKEIHISSLTPARSVIFRAKARDDDEGVNAELEFGLGSENYGLFTINRTSGTLSTLRDLRASDVTTYMLVLTCNDKGPGDKHALSPLNIRVLAENATMLTSGRVNEDHIIIVVVLVCLTILTAACVTAILLRLRHTDRRDRHRRAGVCKASAYHLREVKGSGHGVEETGTPELGRDSDDDLILFKLQLAEQYKERDLYSSKSSPSRHPLVKDMQETASSDVSIASNDVSNQPTMNRLAAFKVQQTLLQRSQSQDGKHDTMGKMSHLDKPQMDEMMSSSSRETNGTDSGRGCSEDDSQAVESVRSETESGFSSFLAMPTKDGWRHVGNHDYANAPMKMVVDLPPPGVTSPYKQQSQLSAQQRPCACSTDSLDQEKPRYEPNQLGRDGSFKTFRTFTPKRPVRTVHFTEDATDSPSSRQTLPASLSMKSREPRFQPQFQSMRPRSNPTHPANA
ncbi:hypothetical protein BaRGS_00004054, partial [Batillaria attramentaria]